MYHLWCFTSGHYAGEICCCCSFRVRLAGSFDTSNLLLQVVVGEDSYNEGSQKCDVLCGATIIVITASFTG